MTLQVAAQKQLAQLVSAIENLEAEKKALANDITDKYAEAKSVGFDVRILRKIIAMRKKSKAELQEEEALIATYAHALGMADTPMGDYLERQDELETAH